MNSNIYALEELTGMLPELDDMSTVFGPIIAIESREKPGRPSFGFGAYRDSDVGIMRLHIFAGDQVDTHVHAGEHQWIIVISGKLRVKFMEPDGRVRSETILNKYGSVHIVPNEPHVVIAEENTWCCTITMPPAAGYPPAAATSLLADSNVEFINGILKTGAD